MSTEDERKAIKAVMNCVRSPTIVDLGARLGEEEFWLREACSEEAHYVMCEADLRNCQVILDRGINRTRRLIVGAIAGYTGSIEFHGSIVDGNTRGSGSIRKPTLHHEIFPSVEFPASLKTLVPCYTLDHIFSREWLSKIDLLWVDIQGAERDMIAGGSRALMHTRYLFIETEDRELYEGMALKSDLMLALPGWTLLHDFGYNCLLINENFKEARPR